MARHPTAAEQAQEWGCSERTARMARYVQKHRPELFELIPSVHTVNSAYRIARYGEPPEQAGYYAEPITWTILTKAWERATPEDQQRFCDKLGLVPRE